MTYHMQLLLSESITGIEILGILIVLFVRSSWLRKFFGNKIENATVHVWTGGAFDPVKGKLFHVVDGEYWYRFKYFNIYREVHCQKDYPIIYENGKREIRAQIGRYNALPLFTPGESINSSESILASGQLVEVFVNIVKSIKKKGLQITGAMIAIILLILVLIGGAGYLYMRSQKKAIVPVSIQTTEINNGQH
jgi:hypothetical protein